MPTHGNVSSSARKATSSFTNFAYARPRSSWVGRSTLGQPLVADCGRGVLHRVEVAAEPRAPATLVEEPASLGPGRAVAVPGRVARSPGPIELLERAVLRAQVVAQRELGVHGGVGVGDALLVAD